MSDGTEFPLEHWNGLMVLRMSYVALQSDFAMVSISNTVWHSRTGHLSSNALMLLPKLADGGFLDIP
jgi:hypothetical protein